MAIAGSVASADDAWMAWTTPSDGQSDGLDVSFRPASSDRCGGQKRFVTIFPRFKNRYTERVAGKLEIVHESPQGSRIASASFELGPEEMKPIETAAFCHENNKLLKLAIVEMRFPDRDAEQRKLAEQKAAAEKAAAEKAAQQRAAAEKSARDVAAAEEARKKQLEERRREAEQADVRQRDEQERRRREVAAAEEAERERARLAAEHHSEDKATLSDLRHGEISVQLPTGFQQVELASQRAGGFLVGGRAEARFFAWLSASGTHGAPVGTGFEFAIAGGAATVIELQSQTSGGTLSTANASARVRFWRKTIALGLFGDWSRYSYSPEGAPGEKHTLYAIGPEAALGFVAAKKLGIELGVRLGAVAPTLGEVTFSDLYMAAYATVGLNNIYAGALATRHQGVSTGSVSSSWNAVGIVGVRLPF